MLETNKTQANTHTSGPMPVTNDRFPKGSRIHALEPRLRAKPKIPDLGVSTDFD